MTNQTNTASSGFSQLGISPKLLSLLEKRRFIDPTPIQQQSIPVAIKGQDVIGIAQTGTGKTLAFGIPMLDLLTKQKGVGLVIVPTRELALQVEESVRPFADGLGLRTAVLIGGASMNIQRQILQKKPRIIIATPGRLIDHMERFRLSLANVEILVLDEADRMLDMGFAPQINRILDSVARARQTMLFSATMPEDIVRMAHEQMKSPVHIEVARAGTASAQVEQEMFFVHKEDKSTLLDACLEMAKGTVIVFTRTKHGATKLNKSLRKIGYKVDEIHSNRSLAQRKRALQDFKSGRIKILVATDIAARGIDVKDISLVINYDIPENPDDYVHRIGRTGRAGATGKAITFAMPDQRGDVRDIERLIQQAIEIGQMPAGIKDPGVAKLNPDERDGGRRRKRPQRRDKNFGRPPGQTRRDAAGGNYRRGGSRGGGRPGGSRQGDTRHGQSGETRTDGTRRSYGNHQPGKRNNFKAGPRRGAARHGEQGGYGGRRSGGSSARTGRSPRSRRQGQAGGRRAH